MKEKIFLILKGFLLGIANIIPGVSGGTLAITLGIYHVLILYHKMKWKTSAELADCVSLYTCIMW